MTTKDKIAAIKQEIHHLQRQINEKFAAISDLENSCTHAWSDAQLISELIEYGIDSFGGSYYQKKWQRECSLCGKVETTYREKMIAEPDFGGNEPGFQESVARSQKTLSGDIPPEHFPIDPVIEEYGAYCNPKRHGE